MPGRLVPIQIPGGTDHAFIPGPLPPAVEIPVSTWARIAAAKQLIGTVDGIGRYLPGTPLLLRPFQSREAVQSSALEGTFATPKQLLIFELDPAESTSEQDPNNASREVLNYLRAIDEATKSEVPISLRLLQSMHAILMDRVRGADKNPGRFRTLQVAIGDSRRFIPPPPKDVTTCMDELERYIHRDQTPFDPLLDCFLVHYQFEAIHPFNDGNGRIGRLLLALMLQHHCKMSKPWLYLSDYFERNKETYIQRLFRISTHNEWIPWIDFCLDATCDAATSTIARCEKLLALRRNFENVIGAEGGSIRLQTIMTRMFESPVIRVTDVERLCDVTYPTAKADLRRLERIGILEELKEVAPITYVAPGIYDAMFGDLPDRAP
jgi:Fic family protein